MDCLSCHDARSLNNVEAVSYINSLRIKEFYSVLKTSVGFLGLIHWTRVRSKKISLFLRTLAHFKRPLWLIIAVKLKTIYYGMDKK